MSKDKYYYIDNEDGTRTKYTVWEDANDRTHVDKRQQERGLFGWSDVVSGFDFDLGDYFFVFIVGLIGCVIANFMPSEDLWFFVRFFLGFGSAMAFIFGGFLTACHLLFQVIVMIIDFIGNLFR